MYNTEVVAMKQISRLVAVLFFSLFSALAWAAGVDINSADASALAEGINGVGEKRAAAIIEYREANGPFQSVDELTKVPGIGTKLLENNRENLLVGKAEQ